MYLKMLKGKIHRAVVKQAELNYVGSITVDPELMAAAGILEYENVQIVDIENGNRFETYTICGEPGSGMICLNGAAARQVQTGDHIILIKFPRWLHMKSMGRFPCNPPGMQFHNRLFRKGGSLICCREKQFYWA